MRYTIESLEEDDDGRDSLFLVVSYFYNDSSNTPDCLHEIRIPAPPTETWEYEEGELGYRRTQSGVWHSGRVEVDGEWQDVPPSGPVGDPWKRVNVRSVDPSEMLVEQIERIGKILKAENVKGPDRFVGDQAPRLKHQSQRKHANHPEFRKIVGKKRTAK